ncbi:hypothetical protein LCGC14_0385110 [marine sediment metagenome]|uniref:Portal protein n=1 Tax=marine sediment metagenome TaxID=412755 RepID=A0A0F9T724_9ZZZZ
MPNYKDLVKEKESEFWDLTRRMDTDKGLQYLDKYVMRDKDNLIVPNMINITLPDTAIFFAEIVSRLGDATEQIKVTSESKSLDTASIEEFQKAAFSAANDRRRLQGLNPLNVHTDEQVCSRGRAGRRVLFRLEDGVLIPDITPWDMRFVTYDFDETGLKWAAYKTERTKGMILAEYDVITKGKTAVVLDVWDKDHNEVWIDDKLRLEQEHIYGFTPVAIQIVPLGSMLADEDSLKHSGESLFFLIRDLVPEINRLMTIAQTINMRLVHGAYNWKNRAGASAEPPDYDEATGIGAITAMGTDEDLDPQAVQDIQRSFTELNRELNTRLQRGSISNLDLGILGSTPPSGVSLLAAKAERDTVYRPRINTKSLLNETTAEMFTKQVIQIGGSVELGPEGHKQTFQTSKLTGEYQTEYKYFVKSPELDAGAVTLAAAYGDLIPERAKRREILQREDPDEDELWLSFEELGRMFPMVKANRNIRDVLKLAEDGVEGAELDAEIASAAMGKSLEQVLAGEVEPPKPEEDQVPKQVIPLLGGNQATPQPRTEQ